MSRQLSEGDDEENWTDNSVPERALIIAIGMLKMDMLLKC
jgi:hypothetical protein